MIKLVNDLLSVSRIDQERVMDRPSMTDLLKVVKDVIAELSIEAEKRHVTIELVEDPASKITPMMIDAGRFRDIMLNLIANGIKYNTKDGKVIVTFSSDGTVIKISVKDTGIGIPEKDKVRIFQKFFRAENAILNATEGSGLGLYLVKSYVEGWGGTVEFESELGKGALFTIKLPINKSQVAK
jgi:two-component system phosphate regulon sensor histidine kinase PhoR